MQVANSLCDSHRRDCRAETSLCDRENLHYRIAGGQVLLAIRSQLVEREARRSISPMRALRAWGTAINKIFRARGSGRKNLSPTPQAIGRPLLTPDS